VQPRYWGTEYDWRKVEARLNALPQFITEIDAESRFDYFRVADNAGARNFSLELS
jgi:hypothetical protein